MRVCWFGFGEVLGMVCSSDYRCNEEMKNTRIVGGAPDVQLKNMVVASHAYAIRFIHGLTVLQLAVRR